MTESNALPMPSHPAGSRRHYQTDGRERVLLVLALGLGFLTADLCLAMWYGVPALGVTLLVLLWEGTLLWYAREGTGLPEKAKRGAGLGLTVAVLGTVAVRELALAAERPRSAGPAGPANVSALRSGTAGVELSAYAGRAGLPAPGRPVRTARRSFPTALVQETGAGPPAALHPAWTVLCDPAADAGGAPSGLCGRAVRPADGGDARFLYEHFGSLLGRLGAGLFLAPFLFSLLYFLRRGRHERPGGQEGTFVVDPALPVTVLLPWTSSMSCCRGAVRCPLGGAPIWRRQESAMRSMPAAGFSSLYGCPVSTWRWWWRRSTAAERESCGWWSGPSLRGWSPSPASCWSPRPGA